MATAEGTDDVIFLLENSLKTVGTKSVSAGQCAGSVHYTETHATDEI